MVVSVEGYQSPLDLLHGFGVLSTYVLAFIGVLWVPAFVWLAAGYWYSSRRPTFRPPPLGLWAMLLSPFVILLYATSRIRLGQGA